MRSTIKLLPYLPFIYAVSIFGQEKLPVLTDTAPTPSHRFPANWYPPDTDKTVTLAVEKNMPYSATAVTTYRDHDPTTKEVVTHQTTGLQFRDSAGRTRVEGPETGGVSNGNGETIHTHDVTITDPVSHCSFRWREPQIPPAKPQVLVECMPRTIHYVNESFSELWARSLNISAATQGQLPNGSSASSESLGKRTFGEIEAEGVRIIATNTTQTGEIRKRVTEMWYSPKIKELVQMSSNDPKDPQSVPTPYMQLTNIKLTEPDPKLFYPPPGYEITPGQVR